MFARNFLAALKIALHSFRSATALLLALGVVVPGQAQAATVVSIQTALGTYSVELFEDLAPNLVARFLSEIEKGTYHFSFVHFAASTFFVSGRYVLNTCSAGAQELDFGSPITAEETGLANTTGTIAMVREPGNPSLMTGEYLINVGNNTQAPISTSPIVIGQILEGQSVADDITVRWRTAMPGVGIDVPTIGYDGIFQAECGSFSQNNLVQTVVTVESVDTAEPGDPGAGDGPANYYDPTTGRVHVKVDAGSEGLLSLAFEIVQTEPQVVIQVIQETVATLSASVDKIATFTALTGTLILPELSIDNVVTYKDMFFKLSNTEQLQFTLQSFSQL